MNKCYYFVMSLKGCREHTFFPCSKFIRTNALDSGFSLFELLLEEPDDLLEECELCELWDCGCCIVFELRKVSKELDEPELGGLIKILDSYQFGQIDLMISSYQI